MRDAVDRPACSFRQAGLPFRSPWYRRQEPNQPLIDVTSVARGTLLEQGYEPTLSTDLLSVARRFAITYVRLACPSCRGINVVLGRRRPLSHRANGGACQ